MGVALSQNTSDRNALEAYRRLVELLGGVLEPRRLLEVPPEKLAEAVRPAGMYRRRVETLRAIAEFMVRHPELEKRICRMSVEDARRLLMRIPGVGPKTADVALLNYCGFPVFPVDTHISRILERWGVRGGYEDKRRWAERFFPPPVRGEVHLLLIELGRLYCRPGKPHCERCPLRDCCPYAASLAKR